MSRYHFENHSIDKIGWLRAAILGANDGLISTASLMMGVATASAALSQVLIAGIAGLVAGAMSMAAGEYVSVSSQSDTERADLDRERRELAEQPDFELRELAGIYVQRGLSKDLADQVARQLMAKDALMAHARDELGITDLAMARPVQAAAASALAFSVGAILPILTATLVPQKSSAIAIASMTLVCLAALGALGAKLGGASIAAPTFRVTVLGALAMASTAAIGLLVGQQL